jgi:ATP-dependent DNA helicase RecQ
VRAGAGSSGSRAPGAQRRPATASQPGTQAGTDLDRAIVELVASARPSVGRTRAVEILRGGRSKVVVQNGYDALELYGAFAHLSNAQTLARVDQLIDRGVLRSTGGRFPKLAIARERLAA